MSTHTSYVIPAYNSAAVIEQTVDAIAKRLADSGGEIIVVENGSTDATPDILARLAQRWPMDGPVLRLVVSEKGLGHALRTGVILSQGRIVVTNADDLAFGFDELDGAQRFDLAAVKVVIGSKAHPASAVGRSPGRTVLSLGYRALLRFTLGLRTGDPQGTYVMDGDWARAMASVTRETGYLYTTEIAYAAELMGVWPVEVPVTLRQQTHCSRIRPIRDSWQMARGLVRLRLRRREVVASIAYVERELATVTVEHDLRSSDRQRVG